MMFGSSYVGTFLGGAGLGIVTARFGLPTGIAAMTISQAALLRKPNRVSDRGGAKPRFF